MRLFLRKHPDIAWSRCPCRLLRVNCWNLCLGSDLSLPGAYPGMPVSQKLLSFRRSRKTWGILYGYSAALSACTLFVWHIWGLAYCSDSTFRILDAPSLYSSTADYVDSFRAVKADNSDFEAIYHKKLLQLSLPFEVFACKQRLSYSSFLLCSWKQGLLMVVIVKDESSCGRVYWDPCSGTHVVLAPGVWCWWTVLMLRIVRCWYSIVRNCPYSLPHIV